MTKHFSSKQKSMQLKRVFTEHSFVSNLLSQKLNYLKQMIANSFCYQTRGSLFPNMFQREKLNFKVIIRFPIKNEKFSVMNLIQEFQYVEIKFCKSRNMSSII